MHKGHSGFRIPPPPKLHFCAPEALECDIPRMATPSGLSGCPGHATQSFVQRGFPRALAHPGHSRPPGREFTTLTSSWLPPPCSFASLWHPPASSLGINLGLEKLDPFGLVWFYTRIFYTLRDASGKRHKLVLLLIIPVSFSLPTQSRSSSHRKGSSKTFLGDSSKALGHSGSRTTASSAVPSPAGHGQSFPHPLQAWQLQAEAESQPPAPFFFLCHIPSLVRSCRVFQLCECRESRDG